jgi:type 1 fimbria pilin
MRICVAVAASYALVLQIALAGMLATQMAAVAAPDASAICYAAGDDNNAHAPGTAVHQSCVICAVAPAVSLPSAAASTIVRFAATVDFQHQAERSALVQKLHSPRSSQGPPQTA